MPKAVDAKNTSSAKKKRTKERLEKTPGDDVALDMEDLDSKLEVGQQSVTPSADAGMSYTCMTLAHFLFYTFKCQHVSGF